MRLKLLFIAVALFVRVGGYGQIAAWDFTGENTGSTTSTAEVYNVNLDSPNLIIRGSGASFSTGNNSFRTTGFQNNGIATTNTDYFQISLSASTGNTLSLSAIDARFAGTATFCVTPGVSNQFAYSLDGTNFTLISSAQLQIGTPATLTQINLSGITALQNVTAATTITLRYYASGQTTTGGWGFNSPNSGEYGLAIGGTVTPAGITSFQTGNWSDTATWVGGVVPTSSNNAIISSSHTVTMDNATFSTRNTGTFTTVNTGGTLATNLNYINNGTTTVNGSFQLNSGGWVSDISGTNAFIYGPNGTLIFNATYGANNGNYWPATNGPVNVTVNSGSDLTLGFSRTISGTFQTAAGVNLSSSTLTFNGFAQINAGGFFNQSPIYGNASTLIYNTGGTFGRGNEWQTLGVGTIGTTAGYPNNIQLSGNTTLNYNNGTPFAKAINGNLTINSGSNFYMDFGGGASGGALTIAGNVTNNGNFTLGNTVGDDLRLGGNFTNTGTFNGNNRAVFFTKNGTQIVTSLSGITIPYVVFSGGTTVQLATGTNMLISAPNEGNAISFTNSSDVFDINVGNTLTIGTATKANTISSVGTFKGSTTSNLALLGTGSVGTLTFATNLNLGTFTMNRQAATLGCTMGSDVTINTALNLTSGLISLGNFDLYLGLTATNTGSADGFVISDPAVGTGMLTKRVNALGAYTLHIGENTAPNGAQYAPATINFNSGTFSASANYGVQVKDAVHPNIDSPTDYLTKYWVITSSGTFTTPIYSFTGLYTTGTADVNGTESNCISAKWDGTKWINGAAIGGGTLTISGLTTMVTSTTNEISAGNRNREINIKGLTGGINNITSGSATANGLNNTLFAATNIGSTATKDYEIQNLGIAALNLTGTPIVSIGGANPGDFTVTSVPLTPIIGGSNTTFVITFSPTYGGIRTAIVSIANDDSTGSESPYTFLIQGTGTCNPAATNTITPTSGPVGTEVTITATANNLTGATATFNGTAATIVSSTATKLVVLVPAGATSGNLVTTNATGCQATNAFTVVDNKANTCEGGTVASDLFFSEVTDATTGGLSYIEIYNGTSLAINMNGYSIKIYSNGDTLSHTTLSLNNFSLSPGSMYIVAIGTTATPDTFNTCSITGGNGSLANQISTSAGINFDPSDNDYIALYKTASSSVVDSFGTFGSDNWADGLGLGDRGATFRRKNTASFVQPITFSNSDWNIINWDGTAQASCYTNDYSDIGVYNFISGTPPNVTLHPSYTPTCKSTTLTVAGTEGYSGGSLLTYKWLYSAPNTTGWTEISDDTNYTGSSTATLSIANISTVLNYQYYCQIRENTNTCYSASNAVKITNGAVATWNGSWTNGPPTIDKLVIINANYNTTTNGDINACSLVINNGFTLTVTAEQYTTIRNDLTVNTTGKLEVLDKGSLVMINDSGTVTNSGTTNIHRQTTPFEPNDYTYWSTPIVSTVIETTFTTPISYPADWHTENSYEFLPANYVDADNDGFDDDHNDWSFVSTMIPGKGYIVMVPYQPFPSPQYTQATVVFSGKVNNGEVTTPIALTPAVVPAVADDDFNLVGNPYPSAISADAFINANISGTGTINKTIDGTLYFWTHKKDLSNTNSGPDTYNYSQDDYVMYNLSGGIGTGGTSTDSDAPKGYIASGQGFFVEASAAGTLTFNNAMRVGLPSTANSQFYKSRPGKSKIVTKDRIWLNLENSIGMFSQQLVGYFDNATLGYDNGYDGLFNDAGNYVNFYSFIDNDTYKIQGRSAFDENDQVRLGYSSAVTGTFKIDIDSKEGVFNNLSTDVYLEDKLLNVIHNLKTEPYTFTTEIGTFNDRFVLRYTNKTLSNNDFETLENQVLVSNKNKQIKVNSVVETIDKVFVYDLLGRQIYKKEKVNSNELTLTNFNSSQQTLLVKVTLQNGKTVTRKVMY